MHSSISIGLGSFAFLLAACGARTAEPQAPSVGAPPASVPPPATSASSDPTPPADQASAAKPKLCGCSLCEPLVSDDACSADTDCAPSAPCHADRCIAKSKAPARDPHQMCTMMMPCHSVDANRCGCHKGRCALIPAL
jgi:hypothetical protein